MTLSRPPRVPRPCRNQPEVSPGNQIAGLTCGSVGADDEIRTRDPHLGKVMLYQLSYVRVSGKR